MLVYKKIDKSGLFIESINACFSNLWPKAESFAS